MKQAREVTTCLRCRSSKRQCDKTRPSCSRCKRGGSQCTYEEDTATSYPTPVTTPPIAVTKVRKRNRVCLSCVRCHRLKVKCDKKQPCSRCSQTGVGTSCKYTHKREPFKQTYEDATNPPQLQEVPFALTGDDPTFVVATWFLRKRGSSHYGAILSRVCYFFFPSAAQLEHSQVVPR